VRQHGRSSRAARRADALHQRLLSRSRRTSITIDFPKEPNVMQQPQPTLPFAPAIGFARNRETAPAYWMLDLLWLVLIDGHETGGAFSVMEQWMRQGSGPPVPHIRPIDEWTRKEFSLTRRFFAPSLQS
jgi:hypothetical protein